MSDHTPQPPLLKTCSKCGEAKPLSKFHRGRGAHGLRSTCKTCTNVQNRDIYRKNKDAHLEAKRRYRSEYYSARLATVRDYDTRNADKRRAHQAVRNAINAGRMSRASECLCARCGGKADIYHHESYKRVHWLDVVPLCRECHGKEHRVD